MEQGNPLVVARLMRATVQQLQAARADPQVFPNTFASRQPVEQLRQYLAMAQSYQELTARCWISSSPHAHGPTPITSASGRTRWLRWPNRHR